MSRAIVILVVLAVSAVATAPAAVRSASRPHLALAGPRWDTLRGSGFRGHEHVRVVLRVRSRSPVVRRVVATRSGTFSVGVRPAPCGRVTASATGALGSRATLVGTMRPGCIAD